MDLSVIIVSWNVRDRLRENLQALFSSQGDFSFEVFVIDNNSGDDSLSMVKKDFLDAKIIANSENLGFSRACNQGIRISTGRYILLLNPDMVVRDNTLINMIRWMDKNKQATVAGCLLRDKNGNIIKQVRSWPGVWNQLAIVIKLPHLFPRILKSYIREDFDYTKAEKVNSIRGGFFMMRNKEKKPFLDEQYFLWFEEVDFCKQVYKNGGEVWYTPTAECLDYVGQSFAQVKRGVSQRYFRDSMLLYFKKWHPTWQYYLLKAAWPVGLLLSILGGLLKFKPKAKT